ncbi:MAG: gliding motility protein GldL [Bacteroidota bacterium]|nr:gliding motility protein GldL [Bacteroidota bacterium]MDP4214865.1 gliding motility protein GldL [Bacteroidota bacterium]MDP4244727.1 gliding motility protein GldL [Bacteroidota bacterium]MDP4255487.1 gliding motility protein GldL [Bacteroidota bacterium]MDP4257970.1 gliding motility protein GldL [Bacteroidota bacterium]
MSAGISKSTEKLVNIIVCVGAAVVIFGALQKILHTKLADFFLTAGLLTEALIFMVYAFLPPPGGEMHALVEALPKLAAGSSGNPALEKMDKMLQEADITPANLGKLSEGFKKFGTTIEQIKDVSGALAATSEYTNKTKEASVALDSMKSAYQNATNTVSSLNAAADSTKQFHTQVQVLTKNLGSLNAIYELELQDTNNHLKAMNSFYGNLVQASETMQGSVNDAKKTQEQIALLAKNLGSLNHVYGNMLSAMQGRQA